LVPIRTPRIVAIELGETAPCGFIVGRRAALPLWTSSHSILSCGLTATWPILDWRRTKVGGSLKYDWLITVDSWKELIALRNGLKEGRPQFLRLERFRYSIT